MMEVNINEDLITVDPVNFLTQNGVEVSVLRLDKIHPIISGNKWFKLKFYLQEAQQKGYNQIVSFGGAYSNHIVATAAACAALGFRSTGIIRGEEPKVYSPTLQTAQELGMKFLFVSREDYRQKRIPAEVNESAYIIPEGGYGVKGAEGAATIPYPLSAFDTICCAVGTGTMIAGLANSKPASVKLHGFSVLKNNFSIQTEIQSLLKDPSIAITLHPNFHGGGYAKYTPQLIQFMNDLYHHSGIPTDFVYTGKLFYGVYQLIEEGYFKAGSRLLLIHSGGLQGNLSLGKGTLIF